MSSQADKPAVPEIDASRPHPARTYNYALGGRDNFAVDRELMDRMLAVTPAIRTMVRENRAFLGRGIRYLAGQAGIRQFLDIGTGLPSVGNVHEVAQGEAPDARVVYVDNDPLVLVHARALLTSSPEGRTAYVHGDLHDPLAILDDPVTRDLLDFTQPIALVLVAVLHFIPDEDKPGDIVATLVDALPPGSYLLASHSTAEHDRAGGASAMRSYREQGVAFQLRDSGEFARLAFGGLDLVPPGVVSVSDWRPDEAGPRPTQAEVSFYGGLARKLGGRGLQPHHRPLSGPGGTPGPGTSPSPEHPSRPRGSGSPARLGRLRTNMPLCFVRQHGKRRAGAFQRDSVISDAIDSAAGLPAAEFRY